MKAAPSFLVPITGLFFALFSPIVQAQPKLPTLFSDHMVLQRDIAAPIWGWAAPGEEVKISGGGVEATATTDASGKWMTKLNALKATPAPFDLSVSTKGGTVTIKDVLVGDVWICSGQSNMQFATGSSSTWKEVESAPANPMIRLFLVRANPSFEPLDNVERGAWQIADPTSIKGFSGVGYYFGKEIAETQKVPVGLIGSYVGGTPAQAWIDLKGLETDPALKGYSASFNALNSKKDDISAAHAKWLAEGGNDYLKASADWRRASYEAKKNGTPEPPAPKPHAPEPPSLKNNGTPTVLNNGMIAPLVPYAIKGAIWYQGESGGTPYANLLTALIKGWRSQWNQGEFPFYAVQLPNYRPNSGLVVERGWPETRQAIARVAETVPNAGMAVAIEAGEEKDLHPPHKRPVGHRLALAVRQKVYGEPIVGTSPVYVSKTVEGGKITLKFKDVGTGLKIGVPTDPKPGTPAPTPASELQGFAIAGTDKKWVAAKAEITGPDTVTVTAPPEITAPAEVAYGWSESPAVNLYNSGDLPASPFRTDLGAKTTP